MAVSDDLSPFTLATNRIYASDKAILKSVKFIFGSANLYNRPTRPIGCMVVYYDVLDATPPKIVEMKYFKFTGTFIGTGTNYVVTEAVYNTFITELLSYLEAAT